MSSPNAQTKPTSDGKQKPVAKKPTLTDEEFQEVMKTLDATKKSNAFQIYISNVPLDKRQEVNSFFRKFPFLRETVVAFEQRPGAEDYVILAYIHLEEEIRTDLLRALIFHNFGVHPLKCIQLCRLDSFEERQVSKCFFSKQDVNCFVYKVSLAELGPIQQNRELEL